VHLFHHSRVLLPVRHDRSRAPYLYLVGIVAASWCKKVERCNVYKTVGSGTATHIRFARAHGYEAYASGFPWGLRIVVDGFLFARHCCTIVRWYGIVVCAVSPPHSLVG
jgi:hypothetical protein